jgi:hypothetical protein
MEASMRLPSRLWVLSDIWSLQRQRLRGRMLLASGTLLGDDFMKLAGRFDLNASRRRPLPSESLRRMHAR